METSFSSNTGDDMYVVEKILKKRYHPTKGALYFVKWKHFPNSANTWEPACNFSQFLIDSYESSHKSKKRRISKSSESSSKTIASENATTSSVESQIEVSRNQPRRNSKQRRQQQVQLQQDIQKQHQLAVFNPIGDSHSLPVVEEVVYEPELTTEPIIVTDVTSKDITVTISECKTPGNFFSVDIIDN